MQPLMRAVSSPMTTIAFATACVACGPGAVADPLPRAHDAIRAPVTRVATARDATCLLREDGSLDCVGDPERAPRTRRGDGPVGYVDVDGANETMCAVTDDGRLVCGGATIAVPAGRHFARVVVGRGTRRIVICGIDAEGRVLCATGDGSPPPAIVGADHDGVAVADDFHCAHTKDGTVTCAEGIDWQVTGVSAMAASASQVCVVRSGSLGCRGVGGSGYAPPGEFASLSASRRAVCGVRTDGSVACWNGDGPLMAPDDLSGKLLGGGFGRYAHACAIDAGGAPSCWGHARHHEAFLRNDDICDDWIAPLSLYLEDAIEPKLCLQAAGCAARCDDAIEGIPHTPDLRARFSAEGSFTVNIHTRGDLFERMDQEADFFRMTDRAESIEVAAQQGLPHDPSKGLVVVNARRKGVAIDFTAPAFGPFYITPSGEVSAEPFTTSDGYAFFWGVAPGTYLMTAARQGGVCRPRLAWAAAEEGTFEVDVVAGEMTFVSFDC